MVQAESLPATMPTTIEDLYPTRGSEEAILQRPDPVIFGNGESQGPYSLNPEQLEFYEQNGYLVVPDVFSKAEVECFFAEYQQIAARDDLKDSEEFIREPNSDQPRSIFSLQKFSPVFAKLACDRRILDKIHQILGSNVYIHHSRINIKRPLNGKSFPWHSDFETWHAEDGLPHCRILSAWVMLTENTEFNGPLYVIPGSHRHFVACAGTTPENHHKVSLRKQEYGVPSLSALRELTVKGGGLAAARGNPGTLILHEGNTMHGSSDNLSPFPRTNLFFVYNSVDNKPVDRPFAANKFRPEFLGSRNFTPLEALDNDFS